jgi:predicted DNA-binding transcriptional regulator YafY
MSMAGQSNPHKIAEADVVKDNILSIDDAGDASDTEKYSSTVRRFHLLRILTLNTCSRQVIFERLKDYYNVSEEEGPLVYAPSQRVGRMLQRDLQYLEAIGFTIEQHGRGNAATYRVEQGSGPASPFLFSQTELDALILLHTLFADPAKYTRSNPSVPLPIRSPHHPFAEDILTLIERLAATLSPQQHKEFDRWTRKPYVYLNLDTITDYLPHRATIDKIIQAIASGRQISFAYAALHRQKDTKLHDQVDPYYITREDEHLYLIGFSHNPDNPWLNRFFEFRIDRIEFASLQLRNDPINHERRRQPIKFCYWIDVRMLKNGLSNRWLVQEVGPEEEVLIEDGKEVRRKLVRAQAYSEFRILQQLHKYGDKVELVEPAALREKMLQEVELLYQRYTRK